MGNIKIKQLCLIVALLVWTSLFQSCNLDQIEAKYSDYSSAEKGGVIDQGWIPNIIIYKSMTNIYQKTNIDLNTCVFSFNLSRPDLELVMISIQVSKQNKLPKGIKAPDWWIKKVTNLDHYIIFDDIKRDTINIAIDKQDNKIYGWRN